MKHILPALFLCLFTFQLTAQRGLLHKDKSLPCLQREFTVMAHIVRDTFGVLGATPQDVQDAIDLVNAWFEPICVRFELSQVETIDNFQYSEPFNYNEWEQMWVNHNYENRINLYIVNDLSRLTYECVFADIGGILNLTGSGLMVQKDCLPSRQIIHAFGHYCGLYNTNELSTPAELVDGSNCETAGDMICDTPADPYDPTDPLEFLGLFVNMECRFIYEPQDANGDYYIAQTGNVMSNYPEECWCGFTYEQFARMAEIIGQSELW